MQFKDNVKFLLIEDIYAPWNFIVIWSSYLITKHCEENCCNFKLIHTSFKWDFNWGPFLCQIGNVCYKYTTLWKWRDVLLVLFIVRVVFVIRNGRLQPGRMKICVHVYISSFPKHYLFVSKFYMILYSCR